MPRQKVSKTKPRIKRTPLADIGRKDVAPSKGEADPSPVDAAKIEARAGGPDSLTVGEFLSLAHSRFKVAEAAEARWRREGLEDLQFYTGDQWPGDIKGQRDLDKRPCLTINRLKPAKRIITNEQRQQR